MPVDRDALAELHQRLADQLVELTSGDEWLAFLAASRQFHRYSPHNQMLLMLQGAEGHVASYRTWQRIPAEGGGVCQVRKGERGLVVLAPMTIATTDTDPATGEEVAGRSFTRFKPVKVFHQGQLVVAPAIATPPLPRLLRGENRHQHVWAAVQSRIEERGFSVDKVSRAPFETWNGRTDFTERTVVVSDHLEPPAALKTLLHEWAHIELGHHARLAGRADLREVEAESVAYLLCGAIGVDSAEYSVPYLASWSGGDAQLLQDTAQSALAAAATMIGELERELSIDLTPDIITASKRHDPERVDAEQDPRMRHPSQVDQPSVDPPEAPLAEQPASDVHRALAALMTEDERRQLLDALGDLDNKLATALELFADAGLEAPRTARVLTDRGVDAARLVPAMIRDEIDHHPDRPHVPVEEIERISADIRATVRPLHPVLTEAPAPPAVERTAASALLGDGDRMLVDRLVHGGHLSEVARVLADAGLDIDQAQGVLREFAVDERSIAATIAMPHYNPVTGRSEPLWSGDTSMAGDASQIAATSPERPPSDVVRRIAETGTAIRLVQLNDAYGLDIGESINLWADAGLAPDVVVAATVAAHHGDVAAAVGALDARWDRETVDWADVAAASTAAGVSTADAILREWELMRSAHVGPSPEMQ